MKPALLIIDHGSKHQKANDMLLELCKRIQTQKPDLIIEAAHMELAQPDIPTAIQNCIRRGATHITAFPYMLSPGRHATQDIPNMVHDALKNTPHITVTVTEPFGLHPKLIDIVLEKTNL